MNWLTVRVERFIKTDIRYLARGGFWLTVSQVGSSVIGLLLAIGFANLLPKEIYGNYRYVLSLASIIGAFTLTGMGTAVVQAVSRGFEGTVKEAFKVKLFWSLGLVAIALAGSVYYWLNDNLSLSLSLLFIGVFSPFIESGKLFNHFLIGKKNFKKSAFYNILYRVIPAIVLLIIIFFIKDSVVIIFAYFLSYALISLFLYYWIIIKNKLNTKIDKRALVFGKQLSFIYVFGEIASYMDRILIFHFLGASQLAIYSFAFIIPDKIRGIFKSAGVLALPKLSQHSIGRIQNTLPRKLFIMLITVLLVAGIYAAITPLLFSVFFPQYNNSVFYSQIASLLIIGGVISLVDSALFAHRNIKYLTALNVADSLFKIALIIGLWYWLGFLGVVIARVIAQWIALILRATALRFARD